MRKRRTSTKQLSVLKQAVRWVRRACCRMPPGLTAQSLIFLYILIDTLVKQWKQNNRKLSSMQSQHESSLFSTDVQSKHDATLKPTSLSSTTSVLYPATMTLHPGSQFVWHQEAMQCHAQLLLLVKQDHVDERRRTQTRHVGTSVPHCTLSGTPAPW